MIAACGYVQDQFQVYETDLGSSYEDDVPSM